MGVIMMLLMAGVAAAEPAAPAKDGAADIGKKVFAAKCVTCHGKDAKGNPAMAKMFKVDLAKMDLSASANQKKTDEELKKVLIDGNGKMPAFKGKLKDEEFAGVLGYMRTLGTATAKADKAAAKPADAKPAAAPETK